MTKEEMWSELKFAKAKLELLEDKKDVHSKREASLLLYDIENWKELLGPTEIENSFFIKEQGYTGRKFRHKLIGETFYEWVPPGIDRPAIWVDDDGCDLSVYVAEDGWDEAEVMKEIPGEEK